MAAATYISYASADRAFARRLGTGLRAAGIDVWLDQIDIRPGDVWEEEQERALAASDCVLVILTPAALASRAVAGEIDRALAGGKSVLPVVRLPCDPPESIRRYKYIDFTTDDSTAFADLCRALASSRGPTLTRSPPGSLS